MTKVLKLSETLVLLRSVTVVSIIAVTLALSVCGLTFFLKNILLCVVGIT